MKLNLPSDGEAKKDGKIYAELTEFLETIDVLYRAYNDEKLTHAQEIILATLINKYIDPSVKIILKDIHLYFKRGIDPNKNPKEFKNYVCELIKRLRLHLLPMALQKIEQVIELLIIFSNIDSAEKIKKRFETLLRKVVNNQKVHLHDKFISSFIQASDNNEKNRIFRESINLHNEFLAKWHKYLDGDNRVIMLRGFNLTGIDCSDLDLTHAELSGCVFNQANLRNIQCQSSQFIEVFGLSTSICSDQLLESFYKGKDQHILKGCRYLKRVTIDKNELVASLCQLTVLECDGNVPNLTQLTDKELAVITTLALRSQYINNLPEMHELSHYNATTKVDVEELFSTRSTTEEVLLTVLKARDYKLGRLVLTMVQNIQMELFLGDISAFSEIIEGLKRVNRDLPEALQTRNDLQIKNARDAVQSLKSLKKQLNTEYTQKLINAFLISLYSEPDPVLGGTPLDRFIGALDAARGRDEVEVDLTQVDLLKLKLTNQVDFTDVFVKITIDQAKLLKPDHRKQRYARLIRAIEDDNISEVKICIQHGLDVNEPDERGRTPFMVACFKNKLAIARYMLEECHADPILITVSNWTIIESVARLKNTEIVYLLEQHNIALDFMSAVYIDRVINEKGECLFISDLVQLQINKPDYVMNRPLHVATSEKNYRLMNWLLENGADVSFKNGSGQTALDIAVIADDLPAVTALLQRSAEISAKTIRFACENNHSELGRLLYDLATPKSSNEKPCVDLYSAVFLNLSCEILLKIINEDLNAEQPDGFTALGIACHLGKLELIKDLLRQGASLYVPCKGMLPLSHAVHRGHVTVVDFLVNDQGVSPTAVIKNCTPPFFAAVKLGDQALVNIMLASKRDGKPLVDLETRFLNRTVLLLAAHEGNPQIVALLLSAGADPLQRDIDGNTPLHVAISAGHKEIVMLLQAAMLQVKNAQGQTPFELASTTNNANIIWCFERLIESDEKNQDTEVEYNIDDLEIQPTKNRAHYDRVKERVSSKQLPQLGLISGRKDKSEGEDDDQTPNKGAEIHMEYSK